MRKEAAFNSVAAAGSLEAAQVSTQGEALKKLTERLNDAQAELRRGQDATTAPTIRSIRQAGGAGGRICSGSWIRHATSIGQPGGDRVPRGAEPRRRCSRRPSAETKAEFDRLNARSFEYQALKREAEADKKLYEELVRKIKEAGINAGFQNQPIRIADPARPRSSRCSRT